MEENKPELMDFSNALIHLKYKTTVARMAWIDDGWYLKGQIPDENSKMTQPYIYINKPECEEGVRRLPWQPNHEDLFADDWVVLD